MLIKFTQTLLVLIAFSCINPLKAQVSPWGTGLINNQLIDTLTDPSVVFASQSGYSNFFPSPNSVLSTYTYDIYIPPSYDGTEPYGLVTFINSGNNGGLISQWQTVLDEKKLIYIAGDNIGNPISIYTRMGVTMAAVYRLKEVLNIDSTRIYSSGNSGGARTANNLIHIYPEWFFGTLVNCGASYMRQVAQDYETQNPNSHYEYGIVALTPSDATYIKSFDRPYAILTSYDDFREGDIMNIYHNGMEQDGVRGKFLETAGPHCATTTEHFRDAVNFVEHPHFQWIYDDFNGMPAKGNGFKLANAIIQNNNLALRHNRASTAKAYSRDPFKWNDAKGSILSTSIKCDSATYQQNSKFHIGLISFEDEELFCDNIGTEIQSGIPNLLTTIVYDGTKPTFLVVVENPNQNLVSDTIFQAVLSDWTVSDTLDIKYHMWDKEIRIELGRHLDPPVVASAGAKMLDDNRSIRIRWSDFGLAGNYWSSTAWQNGTLLTFTSEAIDTLSNNTFMSMEKVDLVSADTLNILPVPNGSILITLSNDTLIAPLNVGPYQWYLNGVAIVGATDSSLQVSQNGNYTLSAYAGSNCEVLSNVLPVTIVGWSNRYQEEDVLRVYPNPNQGLFTLQTNHYPIDIEIHNALGQKVKEVRINSSTYEFDLRDQAKGMYFIHLNNEGTKRRQTQKVVLH